jgi:protein phosphatase 1L
MRLYLLKPEVLFIGIIVCILLFYLQAAEVWHRGIFVKLSSTLGISKTTRISKLSILTSAAEKESWEQVKSTSSVYAVQGRRPKMEDR